MTFKQRAAFFSLLVLCSLTSCSVLQPGAGKTGIYEKFTVSTFDTSPAIDDNNRKVIVENGAARLAGVGDVFGSSKESKWILVNYNNFLGATGDGEGSITESGAEGHAEVYKTRNAWGLGWKWNQTFMAADIEIEWVPDAVDSIRNSDVYIVMWKDSSNYVYLRYEAEVPAAGERYKLRVVSGVGHAGTNHALTAGIGAVERIRLRIRRDTADNNFTFLYQAYSGGSWSAWAQVFSGRITSPTFNATHPLYPGIFADTSRSLSDGSYTPEFDNFRQNADVIPLQRFWDDSPEIHVIANEKVQWAFDAGAQKAWRLAGASAVGSQPGTSSIRFKVGLSNSSERSSATWYEDGKWKSISEINAAAEKGELDGYRYIFVTAQFNSSGKDQPSLTSFSIHGTCLPAAEGSK